MGNVVFAADDGVHGRELWVSDDQGGAVLVDINPGAESSNPDSLTLVNGRVVFIATSSAGGREMWSVGHDRQAVQLLDVIPGSGNSNPVILAQAGGKVFFTANATATGRELYVTDGTTGGTYLVKDIRPGAAAASGITYVGKIGNHIVFLANDGVTGREMWASDGTAAGTVLLADINPGAAGVSVSYNQYTQTSYVETREINGKLQFYVGAPNFNPMTWWETDGTAAGTRVVPAELGPADRGPSTYIAGKAYFAANDGAGAAIWVSDGTQAGTLRLTTPQSGSFSNPNFTAVGDKVVFAGADATNGKELWVTDGTAAGTGLLKDIVPGSGSTSILDIEAFGTKALLSARMADQSWGIWVTDGTTAGTTLLKTMPYFNGSPFVPVGEMGDKFLYRAIISGNGGSTEQLWVTDGTAAGTSQLATYVQDVFIPVPRQELPTDFIRVGDRYVYIAGNAAIGRELWATDGTLSGTRPLMNAGPGMIDGAYSNFRVVDGVLYFTTTTAVTGTELWRTDGTTAGTRIVADVNPAPDLVVSTTVSTEYAAFKEGALFHIQSPDETYQLWFSDGSEAGTVRLTTGDKIGYSPVVAGDRAFFLADIGGKGWELWVTDGTTAGTQLTLELAPGAASGVMDYPRILNDKALVSALNKAQLWVSDGTAEGTIKLVDAGNGFTSVSTVFDDRAFVVVNAGGASQMWITDGTTAGTHYLTVIPTPDLSWGAFDGVVQVGGGWLFAGLDSGGQSELWFTDGTPAGTHLFMDINPAGGSTVTQFGVIGDKTFFIADDGAGGDLWVTDGTVAGTTNLGPAGELLGLRDVTGPWGQVIRHQIATVGDDQLLFFQGNELWTSDGTVAGTVRLGGPFSRSSIYAVTFQDGQVYFPVRTNSGSNYDLWTTDGTAAGTVRLVQSKLDYHATFPPMLPSLDGEFVYVITGDGAEAGLWATDGTAAGSRQLSTATPVGQAVELGGRLIYSGYRPSDFGTYDYELWSVGTDGAVRIELAAGTRGSFPQKLQVLNGVAYFIADAVGDRYELWGTDGTAAGTQRVAELKLGGAEDDVYLDIVNGKLVFMADDGVNGYELWTSDGTAAGTTRVTNTVGPGDSNPGPATELPTPPPPPTINGTVRTDTLNGTSVGEIINGLGGNDTLNGNGGDDTLNGGDGADQLFGGAGIDTLVGGAGNDRLDGGDGADVLRGGVGNDVYVVGAGDVIEELAGEGLDSVTASVSFTLSANVENLTLTTIRPIDGFGNDLANKITGTNYANRLEGGGGVDTLDGLNGNDIILGGSGGDIIQGGGGNDVITGGTGNDTIRGGNGADVFVVLQESVGVNEIDTLNDFYLSQGDIIDLSAIDANALVDGDQAFSLVSAFSKAAGQMTLTWVASQARTLLKLDVNGDGKVDYQMKINGNVTGASDDWAL